MMSSHASVMDIIHPLVSTNTTLNKSSFTETIKAMIGSGLNITECGEGYCIHMCVEELYTRILTN